MSSSDTSFLLLQVEHRFALRRGAPSTLRCPALTLCLPLFQRSLSLTNRTRFLDEDTACSTFDEENQTTYVLPAVLYQRPNSSSLMSASCPSLGTAICARLAGILERVDACTSAPRIRGSSSSDSGPPIMMGGRARGRVMGRDVKGATEEDLITWGGGKRRPPEAGNALAARTERRGWVSQDDKTRDVDPSGKDTSMVVFLDGGEPNRRLRDFGGVESPIGMNLSS